MNELELKELFKEQVSPYRYVFVGPYKKKRRGCKYLGSETVYRFYPDRIGYSYRTVRFDSGHFPESFLLLIQNHKYDEELSKRHGYPTFIPNDKIN